MFGGFDLKDGPINNMYELDFSQNELCWSKVNINGPIQFPLFRCAGTQSDTDLFLIGGIVNN